MAEPEVFVLAAEVLPPVQLTVHSMNHHPLKREIFGKKAKNVYFSRQIIAALQHVSVILKSSHEHASVFVQWLSPPSL
ncbi:hypothetical protein [Polaromonas sp. SM01]|uniref:hypothetical protein n=1 Tax=Polaromonas sp. SM01 TaxID=3085630 RepID=UPI002982697C|nr:hypothetical protein [Polaromonas sp. SM01]MDW5444130.1 hypothetical protein [Polaromonas sp. SM01]